jgi:hypothetical protein
MYNGHQIYGSSNPTLRNTIVAYSTAGDDCAGDDPVISEGYNLDTDYTCGLGADGDLPNTDPGLGPLQDNGGPTWTHALPPGSPAIDWIPSGSNGCGTTVTQDQRGVPRPLDGNSDTVEACDIGAYESVGAFMGPVVTMARGTTYEELQWTHTPPNTAYEIWRSTEPYFDRALGEGELVDTLEAVPGLMTYEVPSGGVGDVGINYFYVVLARLGPEVSSAANRVGEFDFSVVPGD